MSYELDLAVSLRYLKALGRLAPSYAFARQLMRELADCHAPVCEYVMPIHRAPLTQLTADEQLWRRTAEQIAQEERDEVLRHGVQGQQP